MLRRSAFRRLSLALAALTALGGCQGFTDPSPMPRGYVFHKNLYKTIPDAKPRGIGIPYTLPGTAKAAAHWRAAARDLAGRILESGALGSGPVFIAPISPDGRPFETAFDHALRGALIEKGRALATAPGQGPALTYRIARVEDRHPAPQKLAAPLPPPPPPRQDLVKVETAPLPPTGAPQPLDLPPVTTNVPPPSASAPIPPALQPVADDIRIEVAVLAPAPDGKGKPQILAQETGIYVVPGADSYKGNRPPVDWKPVTWGVR